MKTWSILVYFILLTACNNPLGDGVTDSTFDPSVNSDDNTTSIPQDCYYQAVMSDDPVAYWRLNESSGSSTANDETTRQIDGSVNTTNVAFGATGPITGHSGNRAAYFNGTSPAINIGGSVFLGITGDQTIEMWLYPQSFADRRNPYAKEYAGSGTITQETNGRLSYYYGTSGGNGAIYQGFQMSSALTLNTWQHVAIVRDLTNMQLHWYINGVLTTSVGANYAAATATTITAYMGQGYVDPYLGRIDELAIYDSALTGAELLTHYQAATQVCN